MKEKELAEKIIKELQEAGLTPDAMLEVLKLAREKYLRMKSEDVACPACDNIYPHLLSNGTYSCEECGCIWWQ